MEKQNKRHARPIRQLRRLYSSLSHTFFQMVAPMTAPASSKRKPLLPIFFLNLCCAAMKDREPEQLPKP